MFNLQGSEIIFILLIALVVLGPEKLPGAIRRATKTYAELRKMGTGFQNEFKSALDEPMREMRQTADLIKESADPKKIAADAQRESSATLDAERSSEHELDDSADESIDEHDEHDEHHDKPVSGSMGLASTLRPGYSIASEDDPDDSSGEAADIADEWADPVDPESVVEVEPAADSEAQEAEGALIDTGLDTSDGPDSSVGQAADPEKRAADADEDGESKPDAADANEAEPERRDESSDDTSGEGDSDFEEASA